MQFIIVSNDKLAPLARRLAHALSIQAAHTGTYWTVSYYKDNEATLGGSQPVIFLGKSEIADSYIYVLPEAFRRFGARCHFEGSKALLIAETPMTITRSDLDQIQEAVLQNELRLQSRGEAATRSGDADSASNVGAVAGLAVFPISPLAALAWPVKKILSAQARRKEYHELQYDYLLSRFLDEGFESYVGGVEGR